MRTILIALTLFVVVLFTVDLKFILEQILLKFSNTAHYSRKRKDLKGLSMRDRSGD